ncbi:HAD hydrolase-like protein [Actinopolymorpha sp. B9G3]|uniref:HAD family hydrolase n=1 Tax=Actinopolymorpha sp. B9G3 TaxID=3158970 RepID=UPI0032D8B512
MLRTGALLFDLDDTLVAEEAAAVAAFEATAAVADACYEVETSALASGARACARKPQAVMVGDNFARDVEGARAVGLGAVWVNRFGRSRSGSHPEVPEVTTLSELPATLSELDERPVSGGRVPGDP